MKSVFFTPLIPDNPQKGMGWIEIDKNLVKRIGITSEYKTIGYGGRTKFTGPDGLEFMAYADNPRGFGGRNKHRFTVHSHNETFLLLAQKKLTIEAILHFVRSWANHDAKVITPGKRTVDLNKVGADTPAYVYFIHNEDSMAVKIGRAKNVQRRLATLQTSSPSDLKLLGVIKTESSRCAMELEESLHKKFKKSRIRGEWFHLDSPVTDYIKSQINSQLELSQTKQRSKYSTLS